MTNEVREHDRKLLGGLHATEWRSSREAAEAVGFARYMAPSALRRLRAAGLVESKRCPNPKQTSLVYRLASRK